MRETFILQFDTTDEPNELLCTAMKLEGAYVQFKTIQPITASDIYEVLTGKRIWKTYDEKGEENV